MYIAYKIIITPSYMVKIGLQRELSLLHYRHMCRKKCLYLFLQGNYIDIVQKFKRKVLIMGNVQTFFESALPSIVSAIIILVIAFIVAGIARSLVVKLLKKFQLDKYTDKLGVVDEDTGSSLDFIGNLIYFIVFLLFLPGVLDRLGMQGVSSPIAMFVSKFLNYLPNIIGAILVLAIGFFVAKLIRQLIKPVLKRLNVDKLQEKIGVSETDAISMSSLIAHIIYVIIVIMAITAALQVLNISAISVPAINMLQTIFNAIPRIFVAIVIIFIGSYIARIAGKLLENILSGVGADGIISKMGIENEKLSKFSLSKFTGEFIRYIIVLLFIVEGFNFLNFEVLQLVGEGIIKYLPYVISSLIILGIALLLAAWVEGIITKKFSKSKFVASLSKAIIIVIAVFMILHQLGFAKSIVNAAFIIILGAMAVAFAVSFGIGGREFAANVLKKVEKKMDDAE